MVRVSSGQERPGGHSWHVTAALPGRRAAKAGREAHCERGRDSDRGRGPVFKGGLQDFKPSGPTGPRRPTPSAFYQAASLFPCRKLTTSKQLSSAGSGQAADAAITGHEVSFSAVEAGT